MFYGHYPVSASSFKKLSIPQLIVTERECQILLFLVSIHEILKHQIMDRSLRRLILKLSLSRGSKTPDQFYFGLHTSFDRQDTLSMKHNVRLGSQIKFDDEKRYL